MAHRETNAIAIACTAMSIASRNSDGGGGGGGGGIWSFLGSIAASIGGGGGAIGRGGGDGQCDIFFSLRLNEAMDEAEELKAAIERARPQVTCFLSGGNPNSANLGLLIPTALANAKMAIVMGSQTYGKKTASNFSTFEEMQYILSKQKPMFLLKMCHTWEEPQAEVMLGSRKYKQWPNRLTQEIVDEVLQQYDRL